jgi:hypothetical protein
MINAVQKLMAIGAQGVLHDVLDDMGFPRSSIEITKDMDEDQKVKELYSCFLAQLEIFNERVNE